MGIPDRTFVRSGSPYAGLVTTQVQINNTGGLLQSSYNNLM